MKTTKHLPRKVLSALLGSALLCSVAGGRAAAETEETYTLDEVVVTANRIPTKVTETAANVTVITRDDIEKGGFTSVAEALKGANVDVLEHNGRSMNEAIPKLNGDNRVLVLVDGRRVTVDQNSVTSRNANALNYLPSLDSIERIEVVRGAASSLYGSDAVGGVINIITRSGQEPRTSATLATGSWGNRKYRMATEGKSGDISYLLTAGRERQDNYSYKDYKTGSVVEHPNTRFEKDDVTFKLDKAIDEDRSLTLFFDHQHADGGWPITAPGGTQYSSNGHKEVLTNNISLAYNWQQEDGEANSLRVYRNYNSVDNTNFAVGGNSSMTTRTDGIDWNQNWRLSGKHTLVGGSEWRHTDITNDASYIYAYSLRESASNYALFVEDRWRLGDGWMITPGVRHDHHSVFGGKTTARLTANRKINDATNVYASWGQFFKAPALDDLFMPYNGLYQGNPNLRPEKGETITLGINTRLAQDTSMQASVFSSRLRDAIEWDYTKSPWEPVNIGQQKNRGLDVILSRKLSPQWDVSAGYSYVKKENKSGNADYENDASNSQPRGYHLGVQYHQDKWNANMDVKGVTGRSRQYFTSEKYWVVDLGASYRINPATRAYVKVYNLTDRAYESLGMLNWRIVGNFPMPSRHWAFGIEHRM